MNTFQFPCKLCGNMIEAELLHCGQRAECPFCGAQLFIPTPGKKGLWAALTARENRAELSCRLGITAGLLALACVILLFIPPFEKKSKPVQIKTAPKKAAVQPAAPAVKSTPAVPVKPRVSPPAPPPKTALTHQEQRNIDILFRQFEYMRSACKKAQVQPPKGIPALEHSAFIKRWHDRIAYMEKRNRNIYQVLRTPFSSDRSLELKKLCASSGSFAQKGMLELLIADPKTDPNVLVLQQGKKPPIPLLAELLRRGEKKLAADLLARYPLPALPERYTFPVDNELIRYGLMPRFLQKHLENMVFRQRDKADLQLAELLIFDGARVTGDMLSAAVNRGSIPLLKILLNSGISIDELNSRGETALFSAVRNGRSEIEKLLLSAGADPQKTNRQGKTPAEFRYLAEFLQNWKNNRLSAVRKALKSKQISADMRLPDGSSLLTDALRRENFVLVKLLLENNASPGKDSLILQTAARGLKGTRNYNRGLKMISFLLSAGAVCSGPPLGAAGRDDSILCDIFKTVPFTNKMQSELFCSLLPYAGSLNSAQWNRVLRELMRKKYLPAEVRNSILKCIPNESYVLFGKQALVLPFPVPAAALREVVHQLDFPDKPFLFNGRMGTPLYWAVCFRRPVSVIKDLLQRKASPHWRDRNGRSVRDIAQRPYVKRLLR